MSTTRNSQPSQATTVIIQEKIKQIEEKYQVTILYACESGSRAWNFASPNSDYDIRFIYAHQPAWYLQVDKEYQRDVIELPIVDEYDINGWELQKSLKLLKKSNPTLLEWISSPIVYRNIKGFKQEANALSDKYFCARSCFYHYQHMAKNNYREHLKQSTVRLKKYFYVLRPLFAMRWLEKKLTKIPMQFNELLNSMCDNKQVRSLIEELLIIKESVDEKYYQPAQPMLNKYIENELNNIEQRAQTLDKNIKDYHAINQFFIRWLGQ
ncbi:nucleotidyltransferase domain-containing protein [Aliikangiella maris]|uniref:Nucleotidyltransferase domain-containing protein n=2 Tax=Aliikangiella maris TaxID=3162458 RepID=A0ABV3MN81_9GAMM